MSDEDLIQIWVKSAWYWYWCSRDCITFREKKRCENLSRTFCVMVKDLRKKGGYKNYEKN